MVLLGRLPRMTLFQLNRHLKPHVHVQGDVCPLCEQPVGQDIARRIEARMREQTEAAIAQARAETAAAAEQAVAAARVEAKTQAEAAALAKLGDIQTRLAQAEQARANAAGQIAALKAEQEAAVEKRVSEIQETLARQKEDLQREKETAVLAEKAKVLKLTS